MKKKKVTKKNCDDCKLRQDQRKCPKWLLVRRNDMLPGPGTTDWKWLGDRFKPICKRFVKRFAVRNKNIKLEQFNELGNDLYGVGGWSVIIRSFSKPKLIKLLPPEDDFI